MPTLRERRWKVYAETTAPRDARIWEEYQKGVKVTAIAAAEGLSQAGVYQILRKHFAAEQNHGLD